jgi:hypothetical protein
MNINKSILFLLLFLFSLESCVKKENVDFTQADQIDLNQQVNASLISFVATLPESSDVDNHIITIIDFETALDIFNNSFIQDNLTKTVFHFEVENTFNRDFEVIFKLLKRVEDGNDLVTYTTVMNLSKTSITKHDVIVEGIELKELKKSNKVRVRIDVINSSTIDNTPGAYVNFKSSTTFYF